MKDEKLCDVPPNKKKTRNFHVLSILHQAKKTGQKCTA